jgi:hypothetical protein
MGTAFEAIVMPGIGLALVPGIYTDFKGMRLVYNGITTKIVLLWCELNAIKLVTQSFQLDIKRKIFGRNGLFIFVGIYTKFRRQARFINAYLQAKVVLHQQPTTVRPFGFLHFIIMMRMLIMVRITCITVREH